MANWIRNGGEGRETEPPDNVLKADPHPLLTLMYGIVQKSRMQFVDFFQFFLELSNCRIWILAIWRKKVTDAGNLAKKVTDAGNLAKRLPLATINLSKSATGNRLENTASFIFLKNFLSPLLR